MTFIHQFTEETIDEAETTVFYNSTKSDFLSFSTAEFRNAFLKTIRQIIRESVRNMSLPGPESFRKLDNSTPPYSARSGSIDMQLQKPKLPGNFIVLRNFKKLSCLCLVHKPG